MGAGIAQVSAAAGLHVVLIDRDQETADKGKAGVHKALTDRVNKGRMKSAERDALLEKIATTADYGALKDCDLVVEAVFEDRKVKSDVIAKIQAVDRRRHGVRLQHLDAADHFARRRVQGPAALRRHPFLLAGRPHDAGRDHSRQADRPQGAGHRARFRARAAQDADRGQRHARLLRQPLRAQLHPGRLSDAARRHAGGDGGKYRAHGRHAGRAAVAQ